MFDLINAFYKKVDELNVDWEAKGFIFGDKTVYSINHDTKLLGRIFEILTEPILQEIADENGYILETPEQQNYYPDFILNPKGEAGNKIAVDVKTTYRSYNANGDVKPYSFTLGSYASFLRNNTKNIAYSYDQYSRHYVIGFVYDRNEAAQSSVRVSIDNLNESPSPYLNLEFFVQEKYKIAGFTPGSGNTENIGTASSNTIAMFRDGTGPFADMGNDVFEFYWRNYPRYKAPEKLYPNKETFFVWVENDEDCPEHIKERVTHYLTSIGD